MIGMTVCSGIGAPEYSAPWIDWRWQSEIEPFPCSVLRHRFPHATNLGDMTRFQEWPDATVDVLCGGTPCQSFSVAGLRKGLADPRGNLMLTYLAIADRYRPRWLVWENVPGVLSSNGGRDFGSFLGGLGQLGYGFAYRVLDAQYVRVDGMERAVPQRRRRVFVVGYLGDWRRAAAVLFDGQSLRRDSPPSREAGKGSARGFEVGPGGGGFTDLSPTLDARRKDGPIRNQLGAGVIASTGDVSHCLNAGGMGRIDYETETMIAHALRGEGFDASEDGTGRGTPLVPVAVAPTLRAGGNATGGDRPYGTDADTCDSLIPVAIQERAMSENPDAGPDGAGFRQDGAAYTLEARTVTQAVAFAQNQRGELRTSDVSPQLTCGGGKPGEGYPAVATPRTSNGGRNASTSEADAGAVLRALRDAVGEEAFAQWGSGILDPLQSAEVLRSWLHGGELRRAADETGPRLDDGALARAKSLPAGALLDLWQRGPDGRSPQGRELAQQLARQFGTPLPIMSHQAAPWAVRRLTPTEAERLQGFPDGWTDVPHRKKPAADGPRYKALGNSWAVNCGRWIFDRIREHAA